MQPRKENSRSPLALMERGWNWGFESVTDAYRAGLGFAKRHRWAAALVLVVVGIFIHSLSLGGTLGSGSFANSDMGRIYLRLESSRSSSLFLPWLPCWNRFANQPSFWSLFHWP